MSGTANEAEGKQGEQPSGVDDTPAQDDGKADRPDEVGGRDGPDPTRYGDWEKAGRCIDF